MRPRSAPPASFSATGRRRGGRAGRLPARLALSGLADVGTEHKAVALSRGRQLLLLEAAPGDPAPRPPGRRRPAGRARRPQRDPGQSAQRSEVAETVLAALQRLPALPARADRPALLRRSERARHRAGHRPPPGHGQVPAARGAPPTGRGPQHRGAGGDEATLDEPRRPGGGLETGAAFEVPASGAMHRRCSTTTIR
jgi:hypothetical protein